MGLIPGWGRSSRGGHAVHCSVVAWRIPWTEEPGGLWSMVVRVRLKRFGMHELEAPEVSQARGLGCCFCRQRRGFPPGEKVLEKRWVEAVGEVVAGLEQRSQGSDRK